MKRLAVGLLFSLLCASNANAAILFFWRAEGTTLDSTHDYYGAGDNTATLVSGAAINTDAGLIGTNGLDNPTGGDSATFTATGLASLAEGSLSITFRIVTWVNGNTLFRVSGTNANDHVQVQMTGTDEIRGRIRSTGGGAEAVNADTTAANIATNTIYHVVVRWDAAADLLRTEVYNSGGTLIQGVTNATAISAPVDFTTLAIGDIANGGSSDFHLDGIKISDDYSEPLENYFAYTSYTQISGGGGGSAVPTILSVNQ